MPWIGLINSQNPNGQFVVTKSLRRQVTLAKVWMQAHRTLMLAQHRRADVKDVELLHLCHLVPYAVFAYAKNVFLQDTIHIVLLKTKVDHFIGMSHLPRLRGLRPTIRKSRTRGKPLHLVATLPI